MTLKFSGDYRQLKETVSRTGFDGKWRELPKHKKQYRTDYGTVLIWWENTKIVTFQGIDPEGFQAAFRDIIQGRQTLG